MHRVVEPELLDDLPPADPRAVGSRADLRRLNLLMGHAGILSRALRQPLAETSLRSRPLRLVELGAGDGTLLLRLARRWSAVGVTAQSTEEMKLAQGVGITSLHVIGDDLWKVTKWRI